MRRGDDAAERKAITDAMERIIAGCPERSDGKLTVKSLAIEAGVGRHTLTQKHTDLKAQFENRVSVESRTVEPTEIDRLMARIDELERRNAELRAELAADERLISNLTSNLAAATRRASMKASARVRGDEL